jgi:hypothetical protein
MTNEVKGFENDKSFSIDFCKFCYENGAFRNPDLTLEDQTKKLVTMATSKLKMSKGDAYMLAKNTLPELKRWKTT